MYHIRLFRMPRNNPLWYVCVISLFLLLTPSTAFSADALIIEDPCPRLADRVPDGALFIGKDTKGVNIDAKAMFTTICTQVREEVINGMLDQAKSVTGYDHYRSLLPKDLADLKNEIYKKALKYVLPLVNEIVLDRLSDKEKAKFSKQIKKNPQLAVTWLENPEAELTVLVNKFITENSDIGKLYVRYSTDGSATIIKGLSELFDAGVKKINQMEKANYSIEIDTSQVPTTEFLEKAGVSGEWLNTFAKHEGAVRGIHQYSKQSNTIQALVKTVGVMYRALQTDDSEKKIQYMMEFIKTIGEGAEGTKIPIVSLMGTIVKSYGELGEALLKHAFDLREQIYKREGYCLGIGPHNVLKNERQLALKAYLNDAYNEGMICPLGSDQLQSRIYYDIGDETQLFFWVGGKFIKGQVNGGGDQAVFKLIDLIKNKSGEKYAYTKYKEILKPTQKTNKNDIDKDLNKKTLAFSKLYNTTFSETLFKNQNNSTGILGLIEESERVFQSMVEKDKKLLYQLRNAYINCSNDYYYTYLKNKIDLDLRRLPTDENRQKKLKSSYVFSYIGEYKKNEFKNSVYKRYSNAWSKLKNISTVTIRSGFHDTSGILPCNRCINLPMKMSITNGEEIPECRLESADENGIVKGLVFSTSPNISIKLSDNDSSATAELIINAKVLEIDGLPYYKRFDPDYIHVIDVTFPKQEDIVLSPKQAPKIDHSATIDAIEGLIAACQFQLAKSLIETLPKQLQDRSIGQIRTAQLYSSEIKHLLSEAGKELKADRIKRARQRVDEAEALFRCPDQESEIIEIRKEMDKQAQRHEEGEAALTMAKNCKFEEARELVVKLPKSSPIRRQVKEVFAREKRARKLYKQAKEEREAGKPDIAKDLFQKAIDTTVCETTRKVIRAQLDKYSDSLDMPPLEIDENPGIKKVPEKLVDQANREIDSCNLNAAQLGIEHTRSINKNEASRLAQVLHTKRDKMLVHRKDLTSLATVVETGDIQQIKTSIQKAKASLTCPGDRDQLKRIVQKIKEALKEEAAANRSAMDSAIQRGQAGQHRASQQRRAVAESIIGILTQVNGNSGGVGSSGSSDRGKSSSSSDGGTSHGGGLTTCQRLWQALQRSANQSHSIAQRSPQEGTEKELQRLAAEQESLRREMISAKCPGVR